MPPKMGRAAHETRWARLDNPATDAVAHNEDLTMLENEIRALLAAPADGATAPHVDRLEYALTSGYARALELEAERLQPGSRPRSKAAATSSGEARLSPHVLIAAPQAVPYPQRQVRAFPTGRFRRTRGLSPHVLMAAPQAVP
jgi:hypothetical protein